MHDLVHFTATDLVAKMRDRELGAVEVFNAHAGVIEATNPEINALVTLCLERALDEAEVSEGWRPVELTPSLNLPAISLPAGFSQSVHSGHAGDFDQAIAKQAA